MSNNADADAVTASVALEGDGEDGEEDSYIDYEAFLTPGFSAYKFANTLTTATNDNSDPTIDLSTPLSRVLFDLQEIDTHIHTLTMASAGQLLAFSHRTVAKTSSVLSTASDHYATLQSAYARLHRDVIVRSSHATEVLTVVERLHETTCILREVSRVVSAARGLDILVSEWEDKKEAGALVRAAVTLRDSDFDGGERQGGNDDIVLMRDLKSLVFRPAEAWVLAHAREAIAAYEPVAITGFGGNVARSVGGGGEEELKARTTAAAKALWILNTRSSQREGEGEGEGRLLSSALLSTLSNSVAAAVAALARSLVALTTLDRSVTEVAARCKNVVALQILLAGVLVPSEGGSVEKSDSDQENEKVTLLTPVLKQLDTTSLHRRFFGALATGLEPRVRDVVVRGGANARILRGAKEKVKSALRACVERGLEGVEGVEAGDREMEVAVMIGSLAALGR